MISHTELALAFGLGVAVTALCARFLIARVRRMAMHDAMTGLPGFGLFNDLVRLLLAHTSREQSSRRVCVLMIDLNGFKQVNDRFGHAAGDHLLKLVAQRLRREISRGTDVVARRSGDEFLCAAPVRNEVEALSFAQRVADALASPYPELGALGAPACVSASIGVAVYPNDGATPEVLVEAADQAMYRAKAGIAAGRRICFACEQPDGALTHTYSALERAARGTGTG